MRNFRDLKLIEKIEAIMIMLIGMVLPALVLAGP